MQNKKFTQISLFSVLLAGRYGGVLTVGESKRLGSMAIATMDRLDGEMQMIDGVVYQARSDGSVRLPGDEETIPSARSRTSAPNARSRSRTSRAMKRSRSGWPCRFRKTTSLSPSA